MSLPLAVSTSLQLIVIVAFQMFALLMLSQQPGYEATVGSPDLTDSQVSGMVFIQQYVNIFSDKQISDLLLPP
jgi:hypothetical protein